MSKAKTLFVLAVAFMGAGNLFGQCSELFFSEYLEGSGNNKTLEIYNPTGAAIDLADYEVHRFNNGGTTSPDILDLQGMLAPYSVFTAVNPSAAPVYLAVADTLDDITFFNGDDALVLINTATGDTIDAIGVVGFDPGSSWTVGSGATSNFTLIRMATVGGGTKDWAVGATQWDVYPIDDSLGLGAHTSNCEVTATGCSELFFAEYIEGSGSNKAIEIYNPTAMAMDLADYEVHRFNNGGTTNPDVLDLEGMIMGYGVYTAVNPSADPILLALADTLDDITFFNGDDALLLINAATGDTIDAIGTFGEDPGSSWPVDTGSTANYTLVRMQSVDGGTKDWSVGATTWVVYGNDDFSFFGSHVSNCEILASGCDGIFFSEYVEGSGSNKALELYNASAAAIDLADYQIHRYNNGGSTNPDTFNMQGVIAPYSVYVIGNDAAIADILNVSDTTGSATFYNGDDALVLVNVVSGDTADVIGVVGEDPGTNWPVGTGATSEFTLVRMFNVTEGTTNWTVGATQWEVFPQNTVSDLGAHSNVCAPPSEDTEVFFAAKSASASEGDGSVSFDISLINPINDTVAIDVTVSAASTATAGVDYVFMDTTIVFMANSTGPVTLTTTLVDDADVESDETVVMVLKNATNGALIGADSVFTLTITDNDYPVYSIGLVTADADNDGIADSLGVRCELRGLVYGVNLSSSALQFALRDTTDGIQVFSFTPVSGYVVNEGDSIVVQGSIDQFRGLAEIVPDAIILASTGNAIQDPVVVTAFDETTENEYIQLNCVWVVDTAQWPAEGSDANVDFTNGVDTFLVRIDKETDVDGTPAPTGYLNVKGIGSQFSFNTPALDGYQLFPQFATDLMMLPAETADLSVATDAVDESAGTYVFDVILTNANPDTTEISIEVDASSTATEGVDFTVAYSDEFYGCGEDEIANITITIIDDADVEGDETVVLNLVSSDAATVITTGQLTLTITETDNIRDLLPAGLVKAFPNPGSNMVRLESSLMMDKVSLINLNGQTVRAVEAAATQVNVQTADLPSGIYLLQVETTDGVWMQRWIKE